MKESIREQVSRIHRAVNDGTVDKDTINAALKEILHLTEDIPKSVTPTSKWPAVTPAKARGHK